jgi:tetratricopeptide (TPR) repeat protein
LLSACQTTSPDQKPAAETEVVEQVEEKDPSVELFLQAISELKKDSLDNAIILLQKLVEIEPAFPKAYTNLGLAQLKQGKSEDAEKSLLQAVEGDDADAVALNHLGIILRERGEFEQAQDHYKRALGADDDYANAHLNYGILLDLYLQDQAAALEQYQRYQQLTGESNETVSKWIVDLQRQLEK